MLRSHMHLIGKFVRSAGRTGFRKGKRGMVGEHPKIVVALESGDSAAAHAVMIERIDGLERRVFKGGLDGG